MNIQNDTNFYDAMEDFVTQEFKNYPSEHNWTDNDIMRAHLRIGNFLNDMKQKKPKEVQRAGMSIFLRYPIYTQPLVDIVAQFVNLAIQETEKQFKDLGSPFVVAV